MVIRPPNCNSFWQRSIEGISYGGLLCRLSKRIIWHMSKQDIDHRHVDSSGSEFPVLEPVGGGHHRCSDCGRVIYSDPKLAVAAIVPMDGGVLLLKRGIEPQMGMWSFPSGYVDRGEKLERALEREVLEECGLEVSTGCLVGVYSDAGSAVVLVVYEVSVTGGVLRAGDETLDARVFALGSFPELAFEHDSRIIDDWRAGVSLRGKG